MAASTATIYPARIEVGSREAIPGQGPGEHRTVLVVYCSRYGNTERIARALGRGLGSNPALWVECRAAEDVVPATIPTFDLLAIGGPTEAFSASGAMKTFLERIGKTYLRGMQIFAFDTRVDMAISGSAAKYVERHLKNQGAQVAHTRVSAYVRSTKERGSAKKSSEPRPATAPAVPGDVENLPLEQPYALLPGMEANFEELGAQLAQTLVASPRRLGAARG
jgi:flavodoxin